MSWAAGALFAVFFSSLCLQIIDSDYPHSNPIQNRCENGSCVPLQGNLLVGRGDKLYASSTCGLKKPQRYCIVSHLEEKKKCFHCDSRPGASYERSHKIQNIIYPEHPGRRGKPSWWQSENGKEQVYIQLDLEAEFHFTHLIMKFRTFRPLAMLVERSSDFGKTWKVYRYFAGDCAKYFPGVPLKSSEPVPVTVAFCDETYSGEVPSTNGEVILKVISQVNPTLKYDPYSLELQDLMKITNLRVNFTKLRTLGDNLLDNRSEIEEKYYYAIYEMSVRGSCWCYGHAEKCIAVDDIVDVPDMIHGRCSCSHNTTGLNCKECLDTHNDLPWKPAIGNRINACKKCNCNEHAIRCNFSQEVYEQSGRISGSVCLECQDNTMGNNCELCQPKYYHDPSKPISDIDTCLPCECYEEGTTDDGLCSPPADNSNIPQCHCKENVMGEKCDQCKPGFWNLTASNPFGCEACTCDPLGTRNESCDPYTGTCLCRPNVIGKDCNQCAPEHYGLSAETDGCKPCECDAGGSLDTNCDVISGQCKCFPHLTGRNCKEPEQSYFIRDLDYTYEAEEAVCTHGNCLVEINEWPRDKEPSWTGTGYMRVYDNSELEFIIDDIPKSLEYEMVIRYDKIHSHDIVDVTAEIIRPDAKGDVCSNSLDQFDIQYLQLLADERYSKASSPICLEKDKRYRLRLSFKSNSNQVDQVNQPASILIDSVVLIPRPNSVNFFDLSPETQEMRREYEILNCNEKYYLASRLPVPESCKPLHYSIQVFVNQGASECNCNQTGSLSLICDPTGGSCKCKTKVVGRTCDRCAEGTYGFEFSEGCKDCDCDPIGAVDNLCDSTGQCKCKNGTYGRTCNECQPGSWDFPTCRPCQCNGYAHTCDSFTGKCKDCRENTSGDDCGICADGYYGEPTRGLPCRECHCPDTIASGHSFASSCELINDAPVCRCNIGYSGSRCDKCAPNYYGHPEKVDGSCQSCNCSGNIDLSKLGNCDAQTGQCLSCLYNTAGFNCEVCKPDYYGDALSQRCSECDCDLLGTNKTQGNCNPITGQCPCMPNVEGLRCDQCKPDHWLIANGTGCIPCGCDAIGSKGTNCNPYTGECDCRDGFGGAKCNQCQSNFWGDPNVECHPCNCNMDGSVNGECHQNNGSCICMEGIGGEKCDFCDRGFVGNAPYCSKCGECFDNWDSTIRGLMGQTNKVIQAASEIRRTGTAGYNNAFESLTERIDQVNSTLINTNVNARDLELLNKDVQSFRKKLNTTTDKVVNLNSELQDIISSVSLSSIMLDTINNSANALRIKAKELSNNATNLQEKDLKGALNLTREAGEIAKNVSAIELHIQNNLLQEADKKCKGSERLIYKDNDTFTRTEQKHETHRNNLEYQLSLLEQKIPDLNDEICDGRGDPCHNLCGGAGCGKCGGGSISCESGAVGKAQAGLTLAEQYEKQILAKSRSADNFHRDMVIAKESAENAKNVALKANSVAEAMKTKFENIIKKLNDSNKDLNDTISRKGARPSEIRQRANETFNLNIELQPKQIEDLARQINNTIDSLPDVSKILVQTRPDHEKANDFKQKSDEAKIEAEKILEKAQKVVEGLKAAGKAQEKAEEAITTANEDIRAIKKQLSQISSETDEGERKIGETKKDVEKLKVQLKSLQTGVLHNDYGAKQVSQEAETISKQVDTARNKVSDLKNQYNTVYKSINNKSKISDNSKSRAQKLVDRARHLSLNTSGKLKELKEADLAYNQQRVKLTQLSSKIDELTQLVSSYVKVIIERSEYYREC